METKIGWWKMSYTDFNTLTLCIVASPAAFRIKKKTRSLHKRVGYLRGSYGAPGAYNFLGRLLRWYHVKAKTIPIRLITCRGEPPTYSSPLLPPKI